MSNAVSKIEPPERDATEDTDDDARDYEREAWGDADIEPVSRYDERR